MKNLHDSGYFQSNWMLKVKSITDRCGLSLMWHDHGIGYINVKSIFDGCGLGNM